MRRCCSCGEDKPDDDFPWKNRAKGIRHPYCKTCKSAYNRKWYSGHSDAHKENTTRNNERYAAERRAVVLAAKSVPCTDCGQVYPLHVLEFDHCRGRKVAPVSSMISGHRFTLQQLLEEIAKCDVVCANCHKERTFSRLGLTDKALAS